LSVGEKIIFPYKGLVGEYKPIYWLDFEGNRTSKSVIPKEETEYAIAA